MRFSQQVKTEISEREWVSPCCITVACYGIACFARSFTAQKMELYTEKAYIAKWAKNMYAKAGIEGKVYVKGETHSAYIFSVNNPFEVEKMLALFGHSGDEPAVRIGQGNLICDSCYEAFAAAAFLCAGTVVNPEKGYNLEFVSPRYKLMQDFAALLEGQGFAPKTGVRKGVNVLYFRASEQIEDMLTFMGASKSTLEVMHMKVYKDLRNTANRITNCETANIDKTVATSQSTIRAIQLLERRGVLDSLPPPLAEAAALRREHPDLSLAELCEVAPHSISRSALSLRFKKIREIAQQIREKQTTPSEATP